MDLGFYMKGVLIVVILSYTRACLMETFVLEDNSTIKKVLKIKD
jgi:hypothetical protein